MKIDYRTYRLSVREMLLFTAEGLLLCSAAAFLFYRHWIPALILSPFSLLYVRARRDMRGRSRRKLLHDDFREVLDILSVSFRAGYSAENALADAVPALRGILGDAHPLVREFALIRSGLRMNVPADTLLLDFGERSGVDEIANFASVFAIARRSGGNLPKIIDDAAARIREDLEIEKEIETAIAGKKLEQQIMSLAPALILLYMQLTAPDFLSVLYGTLPGVLLMTILLLLYAAAYLAGRRIVSIEV